MERFDILIDFGVVFFLYFGVFFFNFVKFLDGVFDIFFCLWVKIKIC